MVKMMTNKQSEDKFKILEDCSWFPFNDEPVINSEDYATSFSNPQVLLPSESCDGKWHMFFHSWIGIHHFISDSGIAWKPRKMVEVKGQFPFIYREKENYYLLYEKHDTSLFASKNNPTRGYKNSRIELRSSTDLITWSKPRVLLEAKDVPFAGDYVPNPRVSNPQLVKTGNTYRLYFGASSVEMPDTSQKFSRYFSFAESNDIKGHYSLGVYSKILIESEPDDLYSNLACGYVKVLKLENSFYAFQCSAFWDDKKKKTSSNLLLLKSTDGLYWQRCKDKPLLTTSDYGWSDTYIMSCDVHYSEAERNWYCYFSSVGHNSKKQEKESIGLFLGTVPVIQESKDERLRTVLASFFN